MQQVPYAAIELQSLIDVERTLPPDTIVYLPDRPIPPEATLPGSILVRLDGVPCPRCSMVGGHLPDCHPEPEDIDLDSIPVRWCSGFGDVEAWCKEVGLEPEQAVDGRAMAWVLRFARKPDVNTLQAIKRAGFRWQKSAKIWMHKAFGSRMGPERLDVEWSKLIEEEGRDPRERWTADVEEHTAGEGEGPRGLPEGWTATAMPGVVVAKGRKAA